MPAPSAESLTAGGGLHVRGEVRDLRIRDDLFDVLGADYHTLARIDAPGQTTPVRVLHRVARDPVELGDAGGPRGSGASCGSASSTS